MIYSNSDRQSWRLYFAPGVWTYAEAPNRLTRWMQRVVLGLRWERA